MENKPKTFKLIVDTVKCIKLTERKDDEIYFVCEADYKGEDQNVRNRFPDGGTGIWSYHENEEKAKDIEVFIGLIGKGVSVKFTIMEQDFGGLVSNLVKQIDDFVGQVTFDVSADGAVKVTTGQGTSVISQEGQTWVFKFAAQGEYHGKLRIGLS